MLASDFIDNIALRVSNWALQGAQGRMHDKEFIERELVKWKTSPSRLLQIKGHMYYNSEQDINLRQRTMIGSDGELQTVDNLPNNKIIDNQYAKLVNQKANYLLGQPFVIDGENKKYIELLKTILDKKFMKLLKNAGKDMLNSGIAWLYPYYDEDGQFTFREFPGYEILPFWKDSEHTKLEYVCRLYQTVAVEGNNDRIIDKVEVYDLDGVHKFILDGGTLIPDMINSDGPDEYHITTSDAEGNLEGYNWAKVPFIALKYNETETPLLKKVKALQDAINELLSDFENNMQEDARNTILVSKNYDGENLGEFRRNLATYGAVKVRYDGETKGGVETLEVKVNSDNYKSIIEILKKAIIENGMGYDAKDDRLSGNPNQMNIQSMYSDIDLDADDMETELQAAFQDIFWFCNAHLANTGHGDFSNDTATIIFNRDMLINEGEIIANCQASVGLLSDETIISQHPWVDDPQLELQRIQKQKEEETQKNDDLYNPFKTDPEVKEKPEETEEAEEKDK